MEILILGGTRLMGIHLVEELLLQGHRITIATRGITKDNFGNRVERIITERTDGEALGSLFKGRYYDVVCDSLAYCSNDVKALLEAVRCGRYVMISSASVYNEQLDIKEEDFDPYTYPLKWCGRTDFSYDEIKRQAECALFQYYKDQPAVAVRFPFVIGKDDYTKRLYYYVEGIIKGIPMNIDNRDAQLSFINSKTAGSFLAWLAQGTYSGAVNGSSTGTISMREVIEYVEAKTGRTAIYSPDTNGAPYNGAKDFSLNTERAKRYGFRFTALKSWIYELLNDYINMVTQDSKAL